MHSLSFINLLSFTPQLLQLVHQVLVRPDKLILDLLVVLVNDLHRHVRVLVNIVPVRVLPLLLLVVCIVIVVVVRAWAYSPEESEQVKTIAGRASFRAISRLKVVADLPECRWASWAVVIVVPRTRQSMQ